MSHEDDNDLWNKVTEDVIPLSDNKKISITPHKEVIEPTLAVNTSYIPTKIRKKGKEIDRNTEKKINQGRIPIEARIDLHGMTQDQAHIALNQFILSSYNSGKRCVLVITGKGGDGKSVGVLKRSVPQWLEQSDIDNIILRKIKAQPKHGGDGALYIYLRKNY
jgi:DNA-nicking Smr family endonuclease